MMKPTLEGSLSRAKYILDFCDTFGKREAKLWIEDIRNLVVLADRNLTTRFENLELPLRFRVHDTIGDSDGNDGA